MPNKNEIIDAVLSEQTKISKPFKDLGYKNRQDYLREHAESRWNPGKSKVPPLKRKKRL